MIVLVTHGIAELMRPSPEPTVLAWADRPDPAEVSITTLSETEILHGIGRLTDGRRREALRRSWDALLPVLLDQRGWPFTREAAHWYGQLLRQRELLGRPMATASAVIAATTLARGARLATRNGADFARIGIELINPWQQP